MTRKKAKKLLMTIGYGRNDAEILLRHKDRDTENLNVLWAGLQLFRITKGKIVGKVTEGFKISVEKK